MRRIVTALAVLALALPTFAQQQPFQAEIDVNAVLLDVIVTDSRGNQILGLSKDDFIVKENGVEQTIESVDYFTNRRLLNEREEQAPFQVERVREERYFILFFDKPSDPSALFDQLTLAREAAKRFIASELLPTDYVAIAGHDVRLKIYSDFSNDKQQLAKALNDATQFGRGITKAPAASGDGPSLFRTLDMKEMVNRTGTVYQALDLLADATRPIRARKNLVLFSPGIADRDELVRAGMLTSRSRHLDPMLESLNAANVSVYGVQLQRDADTTPVYHQRLEEMSDSTGGAYSRLNLTYGPALERVEETNNGYYLLSYSARHQRGKTGFQKVEVSLRNPEFRVTSRSGYRY